MPDMIGTPVGAMIQPPNPMSGINAISGIFGIQQQKQQLQTGQYFQQQQQAKAIQDQQAARETQAGASLLSNPIENGILLSDGKTPAPNAQSIIMRTMPTTGAARYADIVKAAQGKVEFDNAKNNLNLNERQAYNSAISGAAAGAQSPQDIKDASSEFLSAVKGSPVEDDYRTMDRHLKTLIDHASDMKGAQGQPEPWRQMALQYGRAVLGAPQTVGAGGIAAPGNDIVQQGDVAQPVVTAPALQGGGATPAGQPFRMHMPPGTKQTLETDPQTHTAVWVTRDATGNVIGSSPASKGPIPAPGSGGPAQPSLPSRHPSAPTAAAPAAASTGFGAPGTGVQIEAVNQRAQQAIAAANASPQALDALTRAKAILEQPGAPNTGGMFETLRGVKNYLSSVGEDTKGATDANSLLKNLARYEASRATAVGLGGTDAARALAHNGSPNVSLDNDALLGIVDQSIATERAMNAYANKQQSTQDPVKLQANELAFRKIPNVIEGYQYGASRNAAEANRFLGEHNIDPKTMAATRQAIKQFESQ